MAKRLKQLTFDFQNPTQGGLSTKHLASSSLKSKSAEFGGSLLTGKRKAKRVLSYKQPMHFVLKSEKAKGSYSFVRYQRQIVRLLAEISEFYGVKLYKQAVNLNHLHLVVKLSDEVNYKRWIRHLSSAIVEMISSYTKTKLTEFFTLRPYSRIITWGRQLKSVLHYLNKNKIEALGFRKSLIRTYEELFGRS